MILISNLQLEEHLRWPMMMQVCCHIANSICLHQLLLHHRLGRTLYLQRNVPVSVCTLLSTLQSSLYLNRMYNDNIIRTNTFLLDPPFFVDFICCELLSTVDI